MFALLFPGQGTQFVGMGRNLAEAFPVARAYLERAEACLGLPLTRILFEGPEEELRRTDIQQPAIVAVSLAAHAALKESLAARGFEFRVSGFGLEDSEPETRNPKLETRLLATAGLSVGEYAALAAAGAIEFEDAVRLTRRRGELMQAASEAVPSGMSAVLGLELDACQKACEKASHLGIVAVANLNSPGQVVIAGARQALEEAARHCKDAGAKRVVPLPVAGAFHTPLMASAAEGLAEALATVSFAKPAVPVVQNVCAAAVSEAQTLRRNLLEQLTSTVLWQRSIEWLATHGVTKFLEIGPGKTLTAMVRRIAPKIPCTPIGEPEAIQALGLLG